MYEVIVKGLEGVGVQAAFGGAGDNAAEHCWRSSTRIGSDPSWRAIDCLVEMVEQRFRRE